MRIFLARSVKSGSWDYDKKLCDYITDNFCHSVVNDPSGHSKQNAIKTLSESDCVLKIDNSEDSIVFEKIAFYLGLEVEYYE